MRRFDREDGRATVVVEEDERVCYAYFLDDGRITGDVWLYNVGETPATPEWTDPDRAPFRNPAAYVHPDAARPPADETGVEVRWRPDGTAEVSLDGQVLGSLASGERPGRALLAARPGPAAGVLAGDA
ncbi:MAG: hypothetical protein ACJ74O_11665 [Frankiaceae bacterium]